MNDFDLMTPDEQLKCVRTYNEAVASFVIRDLFVRVSEKTAIFDGTEGVSKEEAKNICDCISCKELRNEDV